MTDVPRDSSSPAPLPSTVTFATGVEAGAIETMAVRLVQSLRKWGGRLADAPFVAVRPRRGPPLKRSTLRQLADLGVTFVNARPTHGKSWFVWMNKPTTLLAAEAVATTDTLAWLDADMLVLEEPAALALPTDVDFAACAADRNAGTADPADPYHGYWQAVANALGLTVEQLPWVVTERERARIRLYFNAGLFAYRRSTGFAQAFMDDCQRTLNARIKSSRQGIVLTDQVVLGLTAVRLGLRWQPLPIAYNFAVGRKLHAAKLYDPANLASVRILHYHDGMWPSFYPQLLADLRGHRPAVADWFTGQPPVSNDFALPMKAYSKALGLWRDRAYRRHEAGCAAY